MKQGDTSRPHPIELRQGYVDETNKGALIAVGIKGSITKRLFCWFLGHDFDDPSHGDYCYRCGKVSQ